jgi:hypothetical protein
MTTRAAHGARATRRESNERCRRPRDQSGKVGRAQSAQVVPGLIQPTVARRPRTPARCSRQSAQRAACLRGTWRKLDCCRERPHHSCRAGCADAVPRPRAVDQVLLSVPHKPPSSRAKKHRQRGAKALRVRSTLHRQIRRTLHLPENPSQVRFLTGVGASVRGRIFLSARAPLSALHPQSVFKRE